MCFQVFEEFLKSFQPHAKDRDDKVSDVCVSSGGKDAPVISLCTLRLTFQLEDKVKVDVLCPIPQSGHFVEGLYRGDSL